MNYLQPSFHRSWSDDGEFDYAGVYRHASESDRNFLETKTLPDGSLIMAIGDTSLYPDVLPLLCARHYLSRSPLQEASHPVIAARRMNEIVYDCCTKLSCLSCFYAQYNPANRMLRYINAGHDAPILIRRSPERVLHLQASGPVFGLQESPAYEEGCIQLRNGDTLVAFTHGIIEAMADQNIRSAEKVIISLVRLGENLKAVGLAQRIISECERACYDARTDKSVLVARLDDLAPAENICNQMYATAWA